MISALTQVKVDGPIWPRNGSITGQFFDPSIYRHFTAWKPVTVPLFLRACYNRFWARNGPVWTRQFGPVNTSKPKPSVPSSPDNRESAEPTFQCWEYFRLKPIQGCTYFWKPSRPSHVGIHWMALVDYSQMSTHFLGFCIILYWPN